jgi:hypothetical protein
MAVSVFVLVITLMTQQKNDRKIIAVNLKMQEPIVVKYISKAFFRIVFSVKLLALLATFVVI